MYQTLCQVVLRLYAEGRRCRADRFQKWALEQIQEVVAFQCGIWAIGTPGVRLNSVFLYNLPQEFISRWDDARHLDPTLNVLVEGTASESLALRSLTTEDGKNRYPDPLVKHCQSFNIGHALCTRRQNDETRCHHFVSLYRPPTEPAFLENECALAQFAVPHLIQAWNINLLSYFYRPKHGPYLSAICDRFGQLHQMECGARELLRCEWPLQPSTVLPTELHERLMLGGAWVYEGKKIALKATPILDLWHLELRRKSREARLSPTQRQVTRYLAKGLTYAEVANHLNISAHTVTKHVNAIYKKLNVRNRTELIAALRAGSGHE